MEDNHWIYEGEWKNDEKSGFGRLIFWNGQEVTVYTGRFEEGMKHG